MRALLLIICLLVSTGTFAQTAPFSLNNSNIKFSGDTSKFSQNNQILELQGNATFSTSIVEIEKADKIVFDKKTKTFTISGFKELRLNGEVQLAEDLGPTTLKIDLGNDCVAYLIAEENACKGADC